MVAAWTRETAAAALKAWAAEHGQPLYDRWSPKPDGMPARMALDQLFGSWRLALTAAGLPAPGRGNHRGPIPGYVSIQPRCACGAKIGYRSQTHCRECLKAATRKRLLVLWAEIATLRRAGLLNDAIAAELGSTTASVATQITRARQEGFDMPPTPYRPVYHPRRGRQRATG